MSVKFLTLTVTLTLLNCPIFRRPEVHPVPINSKKSPIPRHISKLNLFQSLICRRTGLKFLLFSTKKLRSSFLYTLCRKCNYSTSIIFFKINFHKITRSCNFRTTQEVQTYTGSCHSIFSCLVLAADSRTIQPTLKQSQNHCPQLRCKEQKARSAP